MDDIFALHRGTAPLLVSVPHDGSEIPPRSPRAWPNARAARPTPTGTSSRLYDVARELGASILVPRYSRYVIDLNRPPDDTSLYPGQNTTGLCPAVQFTGEPVYLEGQAPDDGRDRRARRDATGARTTKRCRRTAAPARRAWPRRVVGRPLDPRQRLAVPVRRPPAGPQPRHRRRRELLAGAAGSGSKRVLAAQSRIRLGRQWPLQGRLHHAPLRRSGATASTRCSWRSASASTWTRTVRMGRCTRARAEHAALCSRRCMKNGLHPGPALRPADAG